jgi:hypothetical protein
VSSAKVDMFVIWKFFDLAKIVDPGFGQYSHFPCPAPVSHSHFSVGERDTLIKRKREREKAKVSSAKVDMFVIWKFFNLAKTT